MIPKVLIITALLTCEVVLGNKFNCTENPVTNGCNVMSFVPNKILFEPDCHRHDVCYSCGLKVGFTQEVCDNIFHDDLHETCETDKRAGYFCKFWANFYKIGVDTFGIFYYHDVAASWCNNKHYGYEACLELD